MLKIIEIWGVEKFNRYQAISSWKQTINLSKFFFIFINRLNITRSGRQKKNEYIGNFKSFKKMRLHPADMQTRRKKTAANYFSRMLSQIELIN